MGDSIAMGVRQPRDEEYGHNPHLPPCSLSRLPFPVRDRAGHLAPGLTLKPSGLAQASMTAGTTWPPATVLRLQASRAVTDPCLGGSCCLWVTPSLSGLVFPPGPCTRWEAPGLHSLSHAPRAVEGGSSPWS